MTLYLVRHSLYTIITGMLEFKIVVVEPGLSVICDLHKESQSTEFFKQGRNSTNSSFLDIAALNVMRTRSVHASVFS